MGQNSSKKAARSELNLLQKNCTPLGLYPSCSWEARVLKKKIIEKKLAPIFKGSQTNMPNFDECPICFLVSKLII